MLAPNTLNPLATPAAPDTAKPALGERTDAQNIAAYGNRLGWVGSDYYGCGGTVSNPCAYPDYDAAYVGTYATYRWMLQHGRIRHARSFIHNPIAKSKWDYGFREGTDDATVRLISDMFNALRPTFIKEVLRGLDYGWKPFEPIWEVREGRLWISRMKHLLNDITTILTDKGGNVTGLRQGRNGKNEDLLGPKAWVYTYDAEAGNPYGRSQLENMRATAWVDWLRCATQLERLGINVSGIVPYLKVPPGSFEDGDGNQVTYLSQGTEAAKLLSQAVGIVLTKPDVQSKGDPEKVAALVEALNTEINVLDMGNRAPAIAGLMQRMQHDEDLMFAGWLLSSRTGMEGEHGTKAEAGVHTDTGILNCEVIDDDIAQQLQPLVDRVLVLNYGEQAKGAVWIKPAALVDTTTAIYQGLVNTLMSNPQVGSLLASVIDVPKIFETLGIPENVNFDLGKMMAEADAEKERKQKELMAQQAKEPKPLALSREAIEEFNHLCDPHSETMELSANCGTGAGGFKGGNTCAKGGGGVSVGSVANASKLLKELGVGNVELPKNKDIAQLAVDAVRKAKERGWAVPESISVSNGSAVAYAAHDGIGLGKRRLSQADFDRQVEIGFWSQNNPVLHEMSHIEHQRAIGGERYEQLSSWFMRDRESRIAGRVSKYGAGNPREFVAETASGMIAGKQYDDEVMALYRTYGGPKL